MKTILMIVSFIGLILTIGAPTMVYLGKMTLAIQYIYLVVGTLLWFGTAPFWMARKSS